MTKSSAASAAAQLTGLTLDTGWEVTEQLIRSSGASGGNFSFGYRVRSTRGEMAFLKALDLSRAMESENVMATLEAMSSAFNYECSVLELARPLSRVVTAVATGQVRVVGNPFPVPYVILELADTDVRGQAEVLERFDDAWALRTLHQVANGLRQLHGVGVAHRDVKPSNVLLFGAATGAKLGDLGLASSGAIAGADEPEQDPVYAPPEVLYRGFVVDGPARGRACDLYHLGSMIAFMFDRRPLSVRLLEHLPRDAWPDRWHGTFNEALPLLRSAFGAVLEGLQPNFPQAIRPELTTMLRQLCEPDPRERGHPRARIPEGNPYDLQRYVSRLDVLASRLEWGRPGGGHYP